jgi:hypothetical protein
MYALLMDTGIWLPAVLWVTGGCRVMTLVNKKGEGNN